MCWSFFFVFLFSIFGKYSVPGVIVSLNTKVIELVVFRWGIKVEKNLIDPSNR